MTKLFNSSFSSSYLMNELVISCGIAVKARIVLNQKKLHFRMSLENFPAHLYDNAVIVNRSNAVVTIMINRPKAMNTMYDETLIFDPSKFISFRPPQTLPHSLTDERCYSRSLLSTSCLTSMHNLDGVVHYIEGTEV